MLIERADRVVVVADSSKIGRIAFARICSLDQVDELITDEGTDDRSKTVTFVRLYKYGTPMRRCRFLHTS